MSFVYISILKDKFFVMNWEDLSTYGLMTKSTMRSIMKFTTRTVADLPDKSTRINMVGYPLVCDCIRFDDQLYQLVVIVISTKGYSINHMTDFINKLYSSLTKSNIWQGFIQKCETLTEDLVTYLDFTSKMYSLIRTYNNFDDDDFCIVQPNLEKGRVILTAIDYLLENNEQLMDLIDKSADLSSSTKRLAKNSNVRQCCRYL